MKERKVKGPAASKSKQFFRFFRFVGFYKPYIVMVFLFSGLSTLLGLVPTYIMKPLTDTVLAPRVPTSLPERFRMLNMLIIALLIVYVIKASFDSILTYQRRWLSEKVGRDIRNAVYSRLQLLSMSFFAYEKAGSLQSRLCYDTQTLIYFISYDLVDFFVAIVTVLGMGAILFYLKWKLALLLLVPLPLIFMLVRTFWEKITFTYRIVHQKMANMSSMVFNSIAGILVTKVNVAERKEVAKFNRVSDDVFLSRMQTSKITLLFDPMKALVIFCCATLVYWIGGISVIRQQLTLGELMVFIGYMWQFYGPLETIVTGLRSSQDYLVASERVFGIIDAEPDVRNADNPVSLHNVRGSIAFNDVYFSYDDKKNVLENISLDIKPGEVIGLTGPSGAGKSTLNLLLCRLYDVTKGSIQVDGYDVKEVHDISLRSHIGFVLQDTWLFFGTIAENISYGKPQASGEEIIAAAKAAGAHDFIMRHRDAYDTFIGEAGIGLSGGERQRIAIARVLLRSPKIIVFDEATSSVDSETEALIHVTIERLSKKHTIIIVSHKLSLLKIADKIFVMDKGRIVEQGSFDQLKAAGGLFSRLRQVQEV